MKICALFGISNAKTIYDIKCTWVANIIVGNEAIYSTGNKNNIAAARVGINSSAQVLPMVYPKDRSLRKYIDNQNKITKYYNLFYKR